MPKPKRAFPQRLLKSQKPFPWRAGIVGATLAILGIVLLFRTFAADVNRAADLNGDGVINITDLSILLSHFDSPGPQGDINGDGQVGITDLSILLSNFGKTVPPDTNDPLVPANVKALTGGNSVGLRWDSSTPPTGKTIKEYRIYRNGTQIGTVVPLPTPIPSPKPLVECFELKGNCYIDKTIAKGTTYQYQVQAVTTTGEESDRSAAISVTPPATGTPEPTINVNLNGHTEFQSVLDSAIPTLKYLYPKIADYLSHGEYAVPTTITINIIEADNPDTTSFYVSGSTGIITINAGYMMDTSKTPAAVKTPASVTGFLMNGIQDMAFLHERAVAGDPVLDWSYLGIRDYLRDFYYHSHEDATMPQGTSTYTIHTDDERIAYFLDWIQRNHEPDYVHRLATLYAKKNFNASYAQFAGGKDIDQLWAEMLGMPDHTGNLVNRSTGKCLTNNGDVRSDAGQLWLSDCANADEQKFTAEGDASGWLDLHMSGRCVRMNREITEADGTRRTNLKSCLSYPTALLRYDKATGTISEYFDGDNFCLASRSQETGEGTLLTMVGEPCEPGKASQIWDLPANSPHSLEVPVRLKNDPTKCLRTVKDQSYGMPFTLQACVDNAPVQETILDFISDGSFKIRGYGCLSPENDGTINGTRLVTVYCPDSKNILWRYENNEFVHAVTSKCMDVGSMAVGGSTVLNDCTSSDSQLFTFP